MLLIPTYSLPSNCFRWCSCFVMYCTYSNFPVCQICTCYARTSVVALLPVIHGVQLCIWIVQRSHWNQIVYKHTSTLDTDGHMDGLDSLRWHIVTPSSAVFRLHITQIPLGKMFTMRCQFAHFRDSHFFRVFSAYQSLLWILIESWRKSERLSNYVMTVAFWVV